MSEDSKFLLKFILWWLGIGAFGAIVGCAVTDFGRKPIFRSKQYIYRQLTQCIRDQTELYNDLCAEGPRCDSFDNAFCSDKRAEGRGSASLLIENHYEGVQCAAVNIKECLEEAMHR